METIYSSFAPLWIPACAGMTWYTNLESFLRKQESRNNHLRRSFVGRVKSDGNSLAI